MPKVNLDALIPRADFLTIEKTNLIIGGSNIRGFSLSDLKVDGHIYSLLRKPDFQRETSEWEPEKVKGLIESFINEDLIPAVILWRSQSYTFIIDGSHRLSALIAWVNDDYGDRQISRNFYNNIEPQQEKIAKHTRNLIENSVGSYKDYEIALKSPQSVKQNIKEKASSLPLTTISLQWLPPTTNPKSAEDSFLKINKLAAPVNPTELKLIECRNKPNGISARAIFKSGTGHQYWAKFHDERKEQIITLAKDINEMLFTPPYKDPIRTLDLPVGGKIHSAQTLPLIFDFINIVNGISFEKNKDKSVPKKIINKNDIENDETGDDTIKYLKNVKRIAAIINSNDDSSLGLHPAVYFYSREGRYKFGSFYAIVALILDFEIHRYFPKFIKIREKFENFLIQNENLVQQMLRNYRSVNNGYLKVMTFYKCIIEGLREGHESDDLITLILNNSDYHNLNTTQQWQKRDKEYFTKERKSEVFIKEALKSAPRCSYCNGYIHLNSMNTDHKIKKREGGIGTIENGQLTHPYCNHINN